MLTKLITAYKKHDHFSYIYGFHFSQSTSVYNHDGWERQFPTHTFKLTWCLILSTWTHTHYLWSIRCVSFACCQSPSLISLLRILGLGSSICYLLLDPNYAFDTHMFAHRLTCARPWLLPPDLDLFLLRFNKHWNCICTSQSSIYERKLKLYSESGISSMAAVWKNNLVWGNWTLEVYGKTLSTESDVRWFPNHPFFKISVFSTWNFAPPITCRTRFRTCKCTLQN